ncbi:MAG: hypothetical protein Q9208_004620 [Pyrenodesmia sp. 3 TL-2023]
MARAMPWHEPDMETRCSKWMSDGSLEFVRLIELLKSSGQQPVEIVVPGDFRYTSGVPAIVFNTTWPTSTCFPAIGSRLETLILELASGGAVPLHGLQSLLKHTTSLRKLSLTQPYQGLRNNVSDYTYSDVFPPQGRCLPALSSLHIKGMAASYHNLASLLFIDCPALTFLQLASIHLIDGHWEDFIEGLRQSHGLQSCEITEPLTYAINRWYCFSDCLLVRRENVIVHVSTLCRYINEGGRHPSLTAGEPDSASAKYMVKLNETLDKLRTSRV